MGTEKCPKSVTYYLNNPYQNQEKCDKESHPTGNDVRLDEKWDPGDDDEHESGKVDLPGQFHQRSMSSFYARRSQKRKKAA